MKRQPRKIKIKMSDYEYIQLWIVERSIGFLMILFAIQVRAIDKYAHLDYIIRGSILGFGILWFLFGCRRLSNVRKTNEEEFYK